MQAALGQLTLAGFDRAEFSLPQDQRTNPVQTPNQGAGTRPTPSTRHSSARWARRWPPMPARSSAPGVTLATRGAAAVAVAAAAAVGGGGALAANAAGQAAENVGVEDRNARGLAGTLDILAVRLREPSQAETSEDHDPGRRDQRPALQPRRRPADRRRQRCVLDRLITGRQPARPPR